MFNPLRELYVMESKRMSLDEELAEHQLVKQAMAGKPSVGQRLAHLLGGAARLFARRGAGRRLGATGQQEQEQQAGKGRLALRNH